MGLSKKQVRLLSAS